MPARQPVGGCPPSSPASSRRPPFLPDLRVNSSSFSLLCAPLRLVRLRVVPFRLPSLQPDDVVRPHCAVSPLPAGLRLTTAAAADNRTTCFRSCRSGARCSISSGLSLFPSAIAEAALTMADLSTSPISSAATASSVCRSPSSAATAARAGADLSVERYRYTGNMSAYGPRNAPAPSCNPMMNRYEGSAALLTA